MKGIIVCTFDLLLRHLKHNIILIFQVVITFIILLGFIGKIQYILDVKNITDTFGNCSAYYYFPYRFTDKEYNAEKILNDNHITNAKVGTIYYMLANCCGAEESVICYNETIIDYANIKLKSGNWFDKYFSTDEVIPVVSVGDKYESGEKIFFKDIDGIEAPAVVIGKIDTDENILTFDTGSDPAIASLKFFVSKPHCNLIVPFNCEKIPSLSYNFDIGKSYGMNIESNGEIIIPENTEKNISFDNIFRWYGTIADLQKMIVNYENDIQYELIVNGVVLAVFLILTAVGIGGINGMQSRLNQKNYVIYYMLGMNRRQCAVTELIRSSTIVIVGSLIVLIMYMFKSVRENIFPSGSILINAVTFICTFFIIAAISCLVSFKYVLYLGKGSIIEHYKNHE